MRRRCLKLVSCTIEVNALVNSLSPDKTVSKSYPKAHFPMISSVQWLRSVCASTSLNSDGEAESLSVQLYKEKKKIIKHIMMMQLKLMPILQSSPREKVIAKNTYRTEIPCLLNIMNSLDIEV